jgi:NADH-quinone oxidoreductase subunit C
MSPEPGTPPPATDAAAGVESGAAPPSRAQQLGNALTQHFGAKITRVASLAGENTIEIEPADLLEVATALRDAPGFKFEMCMDVCGVDYLEYGRTEWKTQSATSSGFSRGFTRLADDETPVKPGRRFAVVYHLLSISLNQRVRLRVHCGDEDQPVVDSVTGIWAGTDWFEREAFDLFGILFKGHPDLRRLLTDYGFIGHPFRKDFPLIGNLEVRYDPEKGRVVYQPVTIEARTLVPKVIRHDNRYQPALIDKKTNG